MAVSPSIATCCNSKFELRRRWISIEVSEPSIFALLNSLADAVILIFFVVTLAFMLGCVVVEKNVVDVIYFGVLVYYFVRFLHFLCVF